MDTDRWYRRCIPCALKLRTALLGIPETYRILRNQDWSNNLTISAVTIAYHPEEPKTDDYCSIQTNGMWYQSWQSGYHDILKRGFPRPENEHAILAELHSPSVPDFLHGGSGDVPFLVSEHARGVLEAHHTTEIEFAPVHVAKIATKGMRRRVGRSGEPEDTIRKPRDISLNHAPTLFAVIGRTQVNPDYESGRHPTGVVSPFDFDDPVATPDLWRPEYRGEPFSAWIFCSDKFKSICETENLSNIVLVPFGSFMDTFRMTTNKRFQG